MLARPILASPTLASPILGGGAHTCSAATMGLRSIAKWFERLIREIYHQRLSDEAAKIAYFLLISLFPFLLVLFSLAGLLEREVISSWTLEQLLKVVPQETAVYLSRYVEEVVGPIRPELLVAAVFLFVWSGSNLLVTLTEGLNRIFGIAEQRRWWHRRLVAMAFVLALGVAVAVWASLFAVASSRLQVIQHLWGLGQSAALYGVLAVVLFAVYAIMPNHKDRPSLRRLAAGALASSAIWWTASVGFRFYLATYARYALFYGFVAGWLILLLWLYMLGYSILVGAVVTRALPPRRGSQSGRSEG